MMGVAPPSFVHLGQELPQYPERSNPLIHMSVEPLPFYSDMYAVITANAPGGCSTEIENILTGGRSYVVLRFIGAVLLFLGIVRLLYVATIPSFSLIELGLLALIYPSLPIGRLHVRRLMGWRFLWAVVGSRENCLCDV